MKVYKTDWNKYGWKWVIHKTNDGDIKLFQKNKGESKYTRTFQIFGEGIELLKKVMKD
ncbi:MAG: hypothetical protein IH934_04825 [Nanoarchaeota archaeon]|nr:hypothetical protein [Nanoarchaeota archaeon]